MTVFVTTWQSPERVPIVYNQVIATQSIKRKVPFQGMFRLHFVPLNMTKSNVANCCAFDNIPFFTIQTKYAFDHEGWAVGEGCCGGITKSADAEKGTVLLFAITSAEVNLLEVGKQVANG